MLVGSGVGVGVAVGAGVGIGHAGIATITVSETELENPSALYALIEAVTVRILPTESHGITAISLDVVPDLIDVSSGGFDKVETLLPP